mmetsp:Transcript_31918/g.85199  ORF Transcript_31918/g.85199 Transcript_31918/m.85199 type:complete len:250 (-) Transcript_31918:109-858(-)
MNILGPQPQGPAAKCCARMGPPTPPTKSTSGQRRRQAGQRPCGSVDSGQAHPPGGMSGSPAHKRPQHQYCIAGSDPTPAIPQCIAGRRHGPRQFCQCPHQQVRNQRQSPHDIQLPASLEGRQAPAPCHRLPRYDPAQTVPRGMHHLESEMLAREGPQDLPEGFPAVPLNLEKGAQTTPGFGRAAVQDGIGRRIQSHDRLSPPPPPLRAGTVARHPAQRNPKAASTEREPPASENPPRPGQQQRAAPGFE